MSDILSDILEGYEDTYDSAYDAGVATAEQADGFNNEMDDEAIIAAAVEPIRRYLLEQKLDFKGDADERYFTGSTAYHFYMGFRHGAHEREREREAIVQAIEQGIEEHPE